MNTNYLYTIFECFNNQKLDYCIQNGYQNMPEHYPTDIDIFYRNATEEDLDIVVKIAAEKTGLKIIQKVAMGYYHYVYWLCPELPKPGFQLELDFQSELSRRSMPHYFIPEKLFERKVKYKNFYIPSPIDEVIYTILRRTVKHNFTLSHLATITAAFQNNTHLELDLRKELPSHIVDIILEIVATQSIDIFEKYYNELNLFVCQLSHKNSTLSKRLSQWYYNITKMLPLRFLYPCGMDIALLAPDGGGKSTILAALKQYGITSFSGVERKYIRPGLFKNIGQYKPNAKPEMVDNPNPHGRKPDGILKSWIRFLIYLVDFSLGYIIKVIPLKWQRKLVVFDRYYYDYYVDMYRYHYSLPAWVPKMFSFLIPRPAVTFVLYAPADVIYKRKKELTLEETQRQCNEFKKITEKTSNAILINVDRPIEEILDDIVRNIVSARVVLTQKKMR